MTTLHRVASRLRRYVINTEYRTIMRSSAVDECQCILLLSKITSRPSFHRVVNSYVHGLHCGYIIMCKYSNVYLGFKGLPPRSRSYVYNINYWYCVFDVNTGPKSLAVGRDSRWTDYGTTYHVIRVVVIVVVVVLVIDRTSLPADP